jgi:hypothetical protein
MPAAATSPHNPALAIATLLCWIFTASLGGYMLRSLIAHDGLRKQLTVREGLHPGVLVGHFSLALIGLVTWVCYLITAAEPVAWLAVGLLMPGIGLGITTVTLWTPYPRSPSADQPGQGSPGQAPAGPPHPGQTQPPGQAPPALAPPAENAVSGRLSDEMLARTLADEALTRKLIDEMIANLPAEAAREAARQARKKPKAYPVAVIPLAHGLGAMATFVLAVVTAAGMR